MTAPQSNDDESSQGRARRWRAWPSRWAMKDAPVATSAERLVLNAYAYHCDSDGSGAYPGPATLAQMTLLDETTIKRARRSLIARKLMARGDQSRARRLPSGQRPSVLDLMIPASWYAAQKGGAQALREINAWRAEAGLEPIGPANRPNLNPAPAKKERADKGRARKPKDQEETDSAPDADPADEERATRPPFEFGDEEPEQEGGLQDPPRGGFKTPQGVAQSPPTTTFNQGPNHANDICGDGRSPTTGSRASGDGGSAASDKTSATGEKPKPAVLRTVVEGVPEPLKQLLEEDWPRGLPGRVNELIAAGLIVEHRTAAQLLKRMARRWQAFGYEDALLSQSGGGIRKGIGVLEELLSPSKCAGNNIDCEDGTELYSEVPCPRCEEAREDRIKASTAVEEPAPEPRREQASTPRPVPAARPNADESQTYGVNREMARQARAAILEAKGRVPR